MKKALPYSFLLMIVIFFGCRKDLIKYNISGRLLESSSNPVPISNYNMQLHQRSDYGLLGGVEGVEKEFKTDANGYFSLSYSSEKPTGFYTGTVNNYALSLTGIDTVKYKGLYPDWYPIPANKDTALNTLYLYKKIEKFVRKIQFNSALAMNDSLEVITSTAYRSTYTTLHGPVPAGTLLVLDTIYQFKVQRYSISANSYFASSTLKKQGYQNTFGLSLHIGDEIYREQLLIYP